jgi:Reverse transcriptase (RNA-dependent DNA polymerase).
MPFGLKNAPATFQRLMDLVLTGLQGIELFVYLDDIVIYASSLNEHEIKFRKLMERLRSANLKLQPDKCEFLRKEVGYLGHVIGKDGVRPDPGKIEAVKNFPIPRNVKNIRQFLGLAGYYRRFIDGFSKIAKPLTNLLKKENGYEWTEEHQIAFNTLRGKLCEAPLLQYPDFSKPFVLTTDASGYAIGGILSQGPIGKDKPIAYTSRVLNDCEQKYHTYEKEALAIVYSVQHFRPYLYGHRFTLVTDHKPLVWFQNQLVLIRESLNGD